MVMLKQNCFSSKKQRRIFCMKSARYLDNAVENNKKRPSPEASAQAKIPLDSFMCCGTVIL